MTTTVDSQLYNGHLDESDRVSTNYDSSFVRKCIEEMESNKLD